MQLLSSDNPLIIRKKKYTMSISGKIKSINNKIMQSKTQHNLNRETVKIFTL